VSDHSSYDWTLFGPSFVKVATIEEVLTEGSLNLVSPCLPDARISNWEFKGLPMVFAIDEM